MCCLSREGSTNALAFASSKKKRITASGMTLSDRTGCSISNGLDWQGDASGRGATFLAYASPLDGRFSSSALRGQGGSDTASPLIFAGPLDPFADAAHSQVLRDFSERIFGMNRRELSEAD